MSWEPRSWPDPLFSSIQMLLSVAMSSISQVTHNQEFVHEKYQGSLVSIHALRTEKLFDKNQGSGMFRIIELMLHYKQGVGIAG
jgi:hypothetical protein